jgi:hypothetical protein
VPKTIAAETARRRIAPIAIAVMIAIASIVMIAAGCARTPYYGDPPFDGSAGSASGPSAAKGIGSAPWAVRNTVVDADRDYGRQASRLQRRERTIEGRIGTIDRQLDIIDMRRRQRLDTEPLRRYRAEPRELLLQRENRNLQFQQRSVSRELNQLEFERRIGQSTPDPFANGRRFPSPSILER